MLRFEPARSANAGFRALSCFLLLVATALAHAGTPPVPTNISVGTGQAYTSLSNADGLFAAINAGGISGTTTVRITSDLAETGAVALLPIASAATITIGPDAASERLVAGPGASGLIRIAGADNVVFDGRFAGSGRFLRFRNTSAAPTFSFTNGARGNSIVASTVEGSDASPTSGTIVFGGSASESNDANTIEGCVLRDRSDVAGAPTESRTATKDRIEESRIESRIEDNEPNRGQPRAESRAESRTATKCEPNRGQPPNVSRIEESRIEDSHQMSRARIENADNANRRSEDRIEPNRGQPPKTESRRAESRTNRGEPNRGAESRTATKCHARESRTRTIRTRIDEARTKRGQPQQDVLISDDAHWNAKLRGRDGNCGLDGGFEPTARGRRPRLLPSGAFVLSATRVLRSAAELRRSAEAQVNAAAAASIAQRAPHPLSQRWPISAAFCTSASAEPTARQ